MHCFARRKLQANKDGSWITVLETILPTLSKLVKLKSWTIDDSINAENCPFNAKYNRQGVCVGDLSDSYMTDIARSMGQIITTYCVQLLDEVGTPSAINHLLWSFQVMRESRANWLTTRHTWMTHDRVECFGFGKASS